MEQRNTTITFSPRTILVVLATAVSLWLVFFLRDILVLLLISFIFAAALDPAVDKLEKKKVPRPLAIAGIFVVFIAFMVLLIKAVLPPAISQFSALAENKELYIDKIASYFQSLSPSFVQNLKASSMSFIDSIVTPAGLGVLSGAFSFLSGLLGFILVLVISFYLLLEKDGTEKWVSSYVPKAYQTKTLSIAKKVTAKMSAWFRGQLLLGVIIFLITLIGLEILRVPYALTLAILAGFLELLPLVGPLIAGGMAAIVALTVSPLLALIVVIFYFLIQQLENHILVPQVMKKSLGLHPVAIIFALLAGAKLLGILGVIISVPVAAAISVIFNELYKSNKGGN